MQDELALRDEVIARRAAEIALLKQAVDALTRRIFGAKSENLDPGQLELLLDPDAAKKAPAAGAGPSAARNRVSRGSRSICPSSRKSSTRPKCWRPLGMAEDRRGSTRAA